MARKITLKQILTDNQAWWNFQKEFEGKLRKAIKTNIVKVLSCKNPVRGYQELQCSEGTGTKFNYIAYPNEVVMLIVHHYYRFKLSLDDVAELMAIGGINLSHQTVHNWTQTFGVELGLKLRANRKGKSCKKWHVDATYIKIEGRWCYLYRAIDKEGNLVDVYLSDVRDQKAAEKFFKQAKNTTGITPKQITTDKEKALYSAIKNTFGNKTIEIVKTRTT